MIPFHCLVLSNTVCFRNEILTTYSSWTLHATFSGFSVGSSIKVIFYRLECRKKLTDVLVECSSCHQGEIEKLWTSTAIYSHALLRIHVTGSQRCLQEGERGERDDGEGDDGEEDDGGLVPWHQQQQVNRYRYYGHGTCPPSFKSPCENKVLCHQALWTPHS